MRLLHVVSEPIGLRDLLHWLDWFSFMSINQCSFISVILQYDLSVDLVLMPLQRVGHACNPDSPTSVVFLHRVVARLAHENTFASKTQ